MDSDAFPGHVGVGQGEGRKTAPLAAQRIFKSLLMPRSHSMAHGIGGAGDVTAEKPKTDGSSLMAKVACLLASRTLD